MGLWIALVEWLLVGPVVDKLELRVAQPVTDESLLFLLILALGEQHGVYGAAIREKILFQPLKDAIVDFDLVYTKLVCYSCSCF